MRVGPGPEGLQVEYVRLHGAWDDVNRRRDAALTPVRPQAFAEDDQPVTLVVDAREELLEGAFQREKARLQELVLG